MDTDPAHVYLTPDDLARRWSIAPGTLENQRSANRGPRYLKLGKGRSAPVRYRLADVLEYEAENMQCHQ